MLDWIAIRGALFGWTIGMAGLTAWFIAANLGCTVAGCTPPLMIGINVTGNGILIALCLWVIVRMMRTDPRLVLSPLVPFAGSCLLFFGFGPLSTFLASETTRLFQASTLFALTPQDVLRTNLLSVAGITVTLLAIRSMLPRDSAALPPRPVLSLQNVTVLFLVTGLILKHLVIMPSIYGTSSFFLPGVLRNLRYLPDLGFALAAMLAASGRRRWTLIFWLLWPWQLLLSFPELSKKTVMLTILLPAIGAFIGHRSLLRFACWLVAAAVLFTMLQNTNAVARWEVEEADQAQVVLGVQERLAILAETRLSGVDITSYLPAAKIGVETWWLRLNYAGPQAAAMALHDRGVTGSFTQNVLIYLVPRLLWPDKPSIVSPGQQFQATVTGNSATQTKVGVTVFADGYWKLGWPGMALFAATMGLIIGGITRLTMAQLQRGQYLYLPAAMIGIQMGGTSTTAFLQNGFLSALPTYLGYCGLVALLYAFLRAVHRSQVPTPIRRDPIRRDPMPVRPDRTAHPAGAAA